MKQIVSIALRLAVICAAAATILGLINMVTAPRIEAYRQQRILDALQEVSGGHEVGELREADDDKVEFYYPLLDSEGNSVGFILRIRANGYGGPMQLIAGFLNDGSVITARLLDNDETPGLGKDAERSWYMEKFEGTGSSGTPVPRRSSELSADNADSVSGSTITFVGIAEALTAGSQYVRNLGGSNE